MQYTIDHELSILRAAYNRAVAQKKIPKSIVPRFDIPDRERILKTWPHSPNSSRKTFNRRLI